MQYSVWPMGRSSSPRARGGGVVALGKVGQRRLHIPGPDHAHLAGVAHARVGVERGEGGGQLRRQRAVGLQGVQLLEQLQRGQRGAAGQRVAGVGVRVQKGPRRLGAVRRPGTRRPWSAPPTAAGCRRSGPWTGR